MPNYTDSTEAVDAIRDLAGAALDATPLSGDDGTVHGLAFVVPNGYDLKVLDLTKYQDAPPRKSGRVAVSDVDSFVEYVNTHGEHQGTTLYGSADTATVVAVLNGHSTGMTPGWGDHTATLKLCQTPNWLAWGAANGKWFTQRDFAEFVEDHLPDFVTPAAGTMLEVARTFEAKSSVEFESQQRLVDGTRHLLYTEKATARAGEKGGLDVPEVIELALTPWKGGPAFKVSGRLRYRINQGELALCVKLDRLDDVLDAAWSEVQSSLREAIDREGLLIVQGTRH